MKVKAISPWFGSKRRLAANVIEALGPHTCYWEPFCGSLSVLLAKPACRMETVNDLHGHLINLARVLREEHLADRLYQGLQRTLMANELFNQACEYLKHEFISPDVEMAWAYFVASWMGRNGVQGTHGSHGDSFCARYSNNGGHSATRFVSAVESIPEWHQRLRGVTIFRHDAFEMIARIKDEKATAIYVDPPYIAKGAKYVHDFEADDHERLAKLLKRFKKARVVVSYYDHPKLLGLYPKWSFTKYQVTKNMGNSRGGVAGKAVEVLISNERKDSVLFAD